jgi:hypothetical protein
MQVAAKIKSKTISRSNSELRHVLNVGPEVETGGRKMRGGVKDEIRGSERKCESKQ